MLCRIFHLANYFLVLLIVIQTDYIVKGGLLSRSKNGTEVSHKGLVKRAAPKNTKAIGGGSSRLIGFMASLGKPNSPDIPGIPYDRFVKKGDPPYANGKNCINGQDPLSAKETQAFITHLVNIAKVASATELGLTLEEYIQEQRRTGFEGTRIVDYRDFTAFAKSASNNCSAKSCYVGKL